MIDLLIYSAIFYAGFKLGVHFYRKETENHEKEMVDYIDKYHETLADLEELKSTIKRPQVD